MYFGNQTIQKLMLGNQELIKLYKGTNLVFGGDVITNLFIKENATLDYRVLHYNGQLSAVAGWYTSEHIAVDPETEYDAPYMNGSSAAGVAFYGAGEAYISGESANTVIANGGKFTTPVGTVTLRICGYEYTHSIDIFELNGPGQGGSSEPDPGDYVDGNSLFGLTEDLIVAQSNNIETMLRSGETKVRLTAGKYKIDRTLTVPADLGIEIYCPDGDVVFEFDLPADTNGIDTYRALNFYNVIFDFNNSYCKSGILYRQNCGTIKYTNVVIRNIDDRDSSYSTNGVLIQDNNVFNFNNVTWIDILKLGDTGIGAGGGSVNGLYVSNYTSATYGYTSNSIAGYLRNCTVEEVHNINDSGDVIYEDASGLYFKSGSKSVINNIEITNLYARNSGKRLLKGDCNDISINGVDSEDTTGDKLVHLGMIYYGGASRWDIQNVRLHGQSQIGIAIYNDNHNIYGVDIDITPPVIQNQGDSFAFLIGGASNVTIDGITKAKARRIVYCHVNSKGNPTNDNITMKNGTFELPSDGQFGFQVADNGFDTIKLQNLTVIDNRPSDTYSGSIFHKDHSDPCSNLELSDIALTAANLNAVGARIHYCTGVVDSNMSSNLSNPDNLLIKENCT